MFQKFQASELSILRRVWQTPVKLAVKGIREGEKLHHELMIGVEDARHSLEFKDHFMIIPEIHQGDKLKKLLKRKKKVKHFHKTSPMLPTQMIISEVLKRFRISSGSVK